MQTTSSMIKVTSLGQLSQRLVSRTRSSELFLSLFKLIQAQPKNVKCPVCDWSGRKFVNTLWHKRIICPKCMSSVRQRILMKWLENGNILEGAKQKFRGNILHFAPEKHISIYLSRLGEKYITADFLRKDCDLQLDITNMRSIKSNQYDIVIAMDVLEHVHNVHKALDEVHRILLPDGYALFTVPQPDEFEHTYENPNIVTESQRIEHFGQKDHLRVFGCDFKQLVEQHSFDVSTLSAADFDEKDVTRHVLFPPLLSSHKLATNNRNIYFAKKSL